jgi:hypothetical protein
MEFIEGAVLVVGGLWLVGRMSRKLDSHPANQPAPLVAPASTPNVTNMTNTAGDPAIVWGEPLDPVVLPKLPITPKIVVSTGSPTVPVVKLPPTIAPENKNMVPPVQPRPNLPARQLPVRTTRGMYQV